MCLLVVSTSREPAGHTATTDPRSQRIRASRRGGETNGSGSQPMVQGSACPHSRAPGGPRPGWAHHKAALQREQRDEKRAEAIMPVKGSSHSAKLKGERQ